MLDNERYQLAKRAMTNIFLHPRHGSATPETFETLLEYQYKTQRNLQRLGVTRQTQPRDIPGANLPIFPERRPKRSTRPVAIHVIGMPKTLKTTIQEGLRQLGDLRIGKRHVSIHFEEEQAGVIKLLHDKRNAQTNYGDFILSQNLINIVLTRFTRLRMKEQRVNGIYMFNRGPLDLVPFTYANFLFGRLDIVKFAGSLINVKAGIEAFSDFRNALLILMVSPGESLRRNVISGDTKHGRAMNPKFLPVLYEQYLSFYQQLIASNGVLPILNESVPYACVDMSGEDVAAAIGRYAFAFGSLVKYFFE